MKESINMYLYCYYYYYCLGEEMAAMNERTRETWVEEMR